jgi:hypothetical protein
MNTNRSPSIGPDPGVNCSGRAFLSVGVFLPHPQFPSTSTATMNVVPSNITGRVNPKNSIACRLRFRRFVAMSRLLINANVWTIVTAVPGRHPPGMNSRNWFIALFRSALGRDHRPQ